MGNYATILSQILSMFVDIVLYTTTKEVGMTGYIISVGYNSAGNAKDVWKELRETAIKLKKEWKSIANEVKRVEDFAEMELFGDEVDQYAKFYKNSDDLTMVIDDKKQYIYQAASGGSRQRDIKEMLRRAVCRLILESMHKKKMEVNISVS